MDENKLLKVLMFSMVFIILFLFAYIGVSAVARMAAPAANTDYAKGDGTSYGYSEIDLTDLNSWITSSAISLEAGATASRNVKIISNYKNCFINFESINGSTVNPDGTTLHPGVGNTYLVTVKKDANIEGFTAYFAKIAGTSEDSRRTGVAQCLSTEQPRNAWFAYAHDKNYNFGSEGKGERCGRLMTSIGSGALTMCSESDEEECYGTGGCVIGCQTCWNYLYCPGESKCVDSFEGVNPKDNWPCCCDSHCGVNQGYGRCAGCPSETPYYWSSDNMCHINEESANKTCAASTDCLESQYCSYKGYCAPKVDAPANCGYPIEAAAGDRSFLYLSCKTGVQDNYGDNDCFCKCSS